MTCTRWPTRSWLAEARITGEVFVVHGGVAAVTDPPRVRTTALAAEHGSADGMRALDSVHRALGPLFPGAPDSADGTTQRAGFSCEDTLVPATETIGFGAPGSGGLGQGAAG